MQIGIPSLLKGKKMTNEWFNLIYRGNRSPKSGWILLPKALVTTAGGKQYPMIYQNSDCLITKQFNVVPICSCKRHSTRLFSVSSNYGLKTSGKELRTPWKMGANWRLRYQGYDRYYITQYTMLLLLPSIGKKEIYKTKYLMPSHHFLGQQSWAHVQSQQQQINSKQKEWMVTIILKQQNPSS